MRSFFLVIRALATGALFLFAAGIICISVLLHIIGPSINQFFSGPFGPSPPDPPLDILYPFGSLLVLVAAFLIFIVPAGTGKDTTRKTIGRMRTSIALVLAGFLVFQLIDAGKPKDLYTLADVAASDRDHRQTGHMLHGLLEDVPDIQPIFYQLEDADKTQRIEDHQGTIQNAWDAISRQRVAIEQLATRDTLRHRFDCDWVMPNYSRLGDIARIYRIHALWNARNGHLSESIRDLFTIHTLSRKALQGSAQLSQKLVWLSIVGSNARTAGRILNEHELNKQDLLQLAAAFAPLTPEELSFQRTWIGEYLIAKRGLDLLDFPSKFIESLHAMASRPPYLFERIPLWLFDLFYRLTLQRNRTATDINEFWEPVIAQSRAGSHDHDLNWVPPGWRGEGDFRFRNFSGGYFHPMPDLQPYLEKARRAKTRGDLLAVYLAGKLGEKWHNDIEEENQKIIRF